MTDSLRFVRSFADADALAQAAAEIIVEAAGKVSGAFALALSGGSTPKRLYHLLATDAYSHRIEWPRAHVFWGDERCVPPDDPTSNYHLARKTLLDHVPIPPENVHRIYGEQEPAQAAALYEQHLRTFFGGPPRFNLILLGMGGDGHTASLFPHTPALAERERWVVASYYAQVQPSWRITLTLPAINAAARVLFLVSGVEKAETLCRVLEGEAAPEDLPARLVQPTDGELFWLMDEAAASRLKT
ncbi:MAG: 6-phosphogluconolactonase [Chloroflexi bacterium]|nr:6-phosphogluconolactonase [Chloroflexota bacterium]